MVSVNEIIESPANKTFVIVPTALGRFQRLTILALGSLSPRNHLD